MPLPTNFTNASPVRDVHPAAHNDVNTKVNLLETQIAGLSGGTVVPLTPAGNSWTITHSLLFRPAVSVTDSAGNVVYCNVRHLSATQIQITTDATFSGEASLT